MYNVCECTMTLSKIATFSKSHFGPTMHFRFVLDWDKPHTVAAGVGVGIGKAFTKHDDGKEEGQHRY